MSKKGEKLDLGNRLNADVLAKLKEAKKEMKLEEKQKQQAELEKRRKEREEREKNKSFSELFEESNLNWKNFK